MKRGTGDVGTGDGSRSNLLTICIKLARLLVSKRPCLFKRGTGDVGTGDGSHS